MNQSMTHHCWKAKQEMMNDVNSTSKKLWSEGHIFTKTRDRKPVTDFVAVFPLEMHYCLEFLFFHRGEADDSQIAL